MIERIATAHIEEDIEVALPQPIEIDQGAIEEGMGITTELKRSTGTMMGIEAEDTNPREKIDGKKIRNIPGGDVSDLTQCRDPAAVHRVGIEAENEALIVTAVEDMTAGLIATPGLVLVHKKPANLGHQGMSTSRPIRHLGPVSKLRHGIAERRLLLQQSRLRQLMNQIHSKTLSDLFLPDRARRPSAPGVEVPTNPT
jgi:hypothetical protein